MRRCLVGISISDKDSDKDTVSNDFPKARMCMKLWGDRKLRYDK